MKFFFPSVTLALVSALTAVKGENPLSCLTSVDPDVDYFPDKVEPLDSVFWSIEYANTYKILSNKFVNETYLLYQCGSEPPADQLDGRHAEVVQIPLLEGVAITQTTMIAVRIYTKHECAACSLIRNTKTKKDAQYAHTVLLFLSLLF
jgi:iron complex transport system substrate-binding protein